MIVPLLIILRSVVGLHEEDDYRPIYTNVPEKGLVLVETDFTGYVYAIFISVPIFGLIIGCHFLIRGQLDKLFKKKYDLPTVRKHSDFRQRPTYYKPGYISRQYDEQV
jgi:hypothetical protein